MPHETVKPDWICVLVSSVISDSFHRICVCELPEKDNPVDKTNADKGTNERERLTLSENSI
jgi:hypothetical protein